MLKSLNTTKPSRSLTRTKKRLALTLISMLFCLNSCSCRFDEKGFTFDRRTLSDTFDDATNKAKQGDLKGALEDYSIILRSSPDAPTYVNRGLVYVYLGDYDAAMEDFNAASEIDPNNFEIYINRGSTRATLRGDLKGAISDFDQAIRINPKSARAYNSRCAARRDSGDYSGVIKDCSQAIQLDPNHVVAYYNRGNSYKDYNNIEAAIIDFSQAIKIDPQLFCSLLFTWFSLSRIR